MISQEPLSNPLKESDITNRAELQSILRILPPDLSERIQITFPQPELFVSQIIIGMRKIIRFYESKEDVNNARLSAALLDSLKKEFRTLSPREFRDNLFLRSTIAVATISFIFALISGDVSDLETKVLGVELLVLAISYFNFIYNKPRSVSAVTLFRNALQNNE